MSNLDLKQSGLLRRFLDSAAVIVDPNIPLGMRICGLLALAIGFYMLLTLAVFVFLWGVTDETVFYQLSAYHFVSGALFLFFWPAFMQGQALMRWVYSFLFSLLLLYMFIFDASLTVSSILFLCGFYGAMYLMTTASARRYFDKNDRLVRMKKYGHRY